MLGVQGSQYGVLLTPMVLRKLPMECRLEWARNSGGKEGDLDFLLSSLHEELKRHDLASCYTSRTHEPTSRSQFTPPPYSLPQSHRRATATLYSAAPTTPVHCVMCSGSYSIAQCSQFLQLPYRGRRDECYRHRLCYACLNIIIISLQEAASGLKQWALYHYIASLGDGTADANGWLTMTVQWWWFQTHCSENGYISKGSRGGSRKKYDRAPSINHYIYKFRKKWYIMCFIFM